MSVRPFLFSYVLTLERRVAQHIRERKTWLATVALSISRLRALPGGVGGCAAAGHVSCYHRPVALIPTVQSAVPAPIADTVLVRNRLVSSPARRFGFARAVVVSCNHLLLAPVTGSGGMSKPDERTVCTAPVLPYARSAQRGRRTQPKGGAAMDAYEVELERMPAAWSNGADSTQGVRSGPACSDPSSLGWSGRWTVKVVPRPSSL